MAIYGFWHGDRSVSGCLIRVAKGFRTGGGTGKAGFRIRRWERAEDSGTLLRVLGLPPDLGCGPFVRAGTAPIVKRTARRKAPHRAAVSFPAEPVETMTHPLGGVVEVCAGRSPSFSGLRGCLRCAEGAIVTDFAADSALSCDIRLMAPDPTHLRVFGGQDGAALTQQIIT